MLDLKNFRRGLAHTHNIAESFVNAVNAFNSQNWTDLAALLSEDVIIYNITDVNFALGKAAALAYFSGLPTDPPVQFEPTNQLTFFPTVYPSSVRGVALWTHEQHGHINAPIKYEFQFEPVTFLLTSLWAQHSQ